MTLSVLQDRKSGPDWPLGSIIVVTPGTPVSIMSLVDASNNNAPETGTTTSSDEYTALCQQIMVQGFKSNAGVGLTPNTGNIYVVRKGTTGSGNKNDYGVIVLCVLPGQTMFVSSAPRNRNEFSPYRYYIDADNANDAAQVTLWIA